MWKSDHLSIGAGSMATRQWQLEFLLFYLLNLVVEARIRVYTRCGHLLGQNSGWISRKFGGNRTIAPSHAFMARGVLCLCKTRTRPDCKDRHTKRHFFSLVWNIKNSKNRKPLISCTLCVHLESRRTARVELNLFQFLFLVYYKASFAETVALLKILISSFNLVHLRINSQVKPVTEKLFFMFANSFKKRSNRTSTPQISLNVPF